MRVRVSKLENNTQEQILSGECWYVPELVGIYGNFAALTRHSAIFQRFFTKSVWILLGFKKHQPRCIKIVLEEW